MIRKNYLVLILALCLGLILTGCPKKTVPVDEATSKKSDDAARLDAEKAAREQAEAAEETAENIAETAPEATEAPSAEPAQE